VSPPSSIPNSSAFSRSLVWLINAFLAAYAVDALISTVDDSLALASNVRVLSVLRLLVAMLVMLACLFFYVLMGLTPLVPKKLILPLTLFGPVSQLAVVPFFIFCFAAADVILWLVSLSQLTLIGAIFLAIRRANRGGSWLLRTDSLRGRAFSWGNLLGFVAANALILIPGALAWLAFCASLAVDHLTHGFMALHSSHITVKAKHYVREDGKEIHLVGMVHIAETNFYQTVAASFPKENSIVLREGVSDRDKLLKTRLGYGRLAEALGLSEQRDHFSLGDRGGGAPGKPPSKLADGDLRDFSSDTIEILELIAKVHQGGLDAPTWMRLNQMGSRPEMLDRLVEDLLRKRNRILLAHLEEELGRYKTIIVPWGVAHMPELEDEIQKRGFHLAETREFAVARYSTILERILSR